MDVLASHVASCCYGGEELKTLYITMARSGLMEEQLKTSPLSCGISNSAQTLQEKEHIILETNVILGNKG